VRTQRRPRGGLHLGVARERASRYDGRRPGARAARDPRLRAAHRPVEAVREEPGRFDPAAAGRQLSAAVEAVAATDVDGLGEEELRARLGEVRRAVVRLEALQMRWNGVLETRALREAGPGREQQALRRVRHRTADELRLTPTEVKRSGETGRRLEAHPAAIEALATGDLPAEHARLFTDTSRWLEGEVRDAAEGRLLEAARTQDARTFGRTCRRLLAEVDSASAQAAEDRRRRRRAASVAQTPDGMTLVRAQLSGIDAEYVHTAFHAFRRPDAPGQHRRPEQRTADALVEICRVALDAGAAPSNRNVRPHVLVTVAEPTVRDVDGTGSGVCETAWSGPLPWTEARRLLADASVSRVLLDPAELPTRAGEAVRTVPAHRRRADRAAGRDHGARPALLRARAADHLLPRPVPRAGSTVAATSRGTSAGSRRTPTGPGRRTAWSGRRSASASRGRAWAGGGPAPPGRGRAWAGGGPAPPG
jgi:hypothetical protein